MAEPKNEPCDTRIAEFSERVDLLEGGKVGFTIECLRKWHNSLQVGGKFDGNSLRQHTFDVALEEHVLPGLRGAVNDNGVSRIHSLLKLFSSLLFVRI